MVLRIPETGLELESSAKTADTLPMQAFAITLSDSVIEDLIQCVENGEDIRLSLGSVPSLLYGRDTEVHKIAKSAEIADLDLYLTDPSDPAQHAERLPHPSMSLFTKPQLNRHPRLAAGREVVREKPASKTSAAGRKARADLPDDFLKLQQSMQKAKDDKKENSTTILDASRGAPGAKRGTTKAGKTNKLLPGKTGSMATAISGSRSGSPALSGIISPSLNPTPSAGEAAKEEARELRAPIVHELAVRELSFEELRSRWPGDKGAFKQVLDKVADFDNKLQKYTLKKLYWKELDTYKYDYESDEDRQSAIDNAIRMYDRMRMSASESVWDRLLPKEERGKGKCLSKLLPTIAKAAPQPAAKTPQIKVNDTEDSSGSKNGDGSVSGAETKKTKKASTPMSRQASQTKQPAKKIERKWVKKAPTPKVSPAKAGAKSKDKAGRVLSKEFISDSDSSSSEAPLSKTAPRAKKESEDREREREREREKEKEREIERDRQREREKEREREREKERLEKQKEREAAAAKQKARSSAPPKEVIKPQVIARPGTQKRPRDEAEEDSSSSSGTPLSKRVNKEIKAAPARASVSYKRPPSESSSQSSRTNNYVGHGYTSKNKNTSPVKSSPLASSPPTNASDMGQQTADENRHERERDRSRDRSVTVANGNINVKKRKMESDGDVIDVAAAKKKKRQRLSTDILNDARTFKKCYEVYQRLHYELSSGGSFSREKYETLMMQHRRLEKLKASIYAQIPAERDVY